MPQEAQLALLQGWLGAVLQLRAAWARTHRNARACAGAEAIFTEVFAQRHHARDRRELSRAELAEISGVSERQVTTLLRWLYREGFTFQGNDASGRKLGVPMLRPAWLVHRVFHSPSTEGATGKSASPSHYKDLHAVTSFRHGEDSYSDPRRIDQERRENGARDKTRHKGGGLAPASSLAWAALRQLRGPPS
jgi:hypothetical protein